MEKIGVTKGDIKIIIIGVLTLDPILQTQKHRKVFIQNSHYFNPETIKTGEPIKCFPQHTNSQLQKWEED